MSDTSRMLSTAVERLHQQLESAKSIAHGRTILRRVAEDDSFWQALKDLQSATRKLQLHVF
jgi:hypothetical protein